MSDTVVAVVSIFFIIGITVGIVVVVALSVLRPSQRGWPGRRLEYGPPDRPDPDWDEGGPDEHPRWP
jgi:hypothetical protein